MNDDAPFLQNPQCEQARYAIIGQIDEKSGLKILFMFAVAQRHVGAFATAADVQGQRLFASTLNQGRLARRLLVAAVARSGP